ncbi:MAG: CapA family protein [Microbacteriaceae bacterium]|nr:CapA family protein [Microbacteriaceae bacterium]
MKFKKIAAVLTTLCASVGMLVVAGCAPQETPKQAAEPVPQAAPEPKKPEPKPGVGPECATDHCVSIAVAGDLLFHHGLWQPFATDGANGKNFNFDPLFAGAKPYLDRADLAICDMETPVAKPGGPYSAYPIFNIPPEVIDGAKKVGFDVCTAATNHTVDKGTDGLVRTLDALDAAGIKNTGSYRTEADSQKPFIVEVNGVKIGLVTATYSLNGLHAEHPWQVDYPIDAAKMIDKAKRTRAAGADIVLAAVHNGNEYENQPHVGQISNGHELIDSGEFDWVYMHNTHSVQPIEFYKGKWIVYGTGNFVSEFAPQNPTNNEFLVVRAQFQKGADGKWSPGKIHWAPAQIKQGGKYAWCSVAADKPSGVCISEHIDAAFRARIKNVVESMGGAQHGLSEWLVTQDPAR